MTKVVKKPVTVSVDPGLVTWADEQLAKGAYDSRSAVFEAALEELWRRKQEEQYEAALAAVTPEDAAEMQAMAEEGMADWSAMVLETTDWEDVPLRPSVEAPSEPPRAGRVGGGA